MVDRLSVSDLCDTAYALWVDRVVGDFRAEQLGLIVGLCLGAKGELPILDKRLADFDEALAKEPPRLDPEQAELRQALGLRGPGG